MVLTLLISLLSPQALNVTKSTLNKISNKLVKRNIFKKKIRDISVEEFSKNMNDQFSEFLKVVKDVLSSEGIKDESFIDEITVKLSNQFKKDIAMLRADQEQYFIKIQSRLEQNSTELNEIIKAEFKTNLGELKSLQWNLYSEFKEDFKITQIRLNKESNEQIGRTMEKYHEEMKQI